MKKIQIVLIVFLTLYLSAQSTASDRLYVTDSFTVTLRTGPSNQNKIVRMLRSGRALQVFEEGEEWSRVGVLENNEVIMEGWVLNQYLISRVPYEIQTAALSSENENLKERLSTANEQLAVIRKEKEDYSSQLQQTRKEMTSLMNDYEILKKGASEYLQLKEDYESKLTKLSSAENALKALEIETIKIRESQAHMWFAIGALVLLFGLIIGSMLGRQSRKKSSSYID